MKIPILVLVSPRFFVMFWFLFGAYTLCLSCAWGFFFLARLHALNFRDYSHTIRSVSHILFLVLVFLSILGYYFVFTYTPLPIYQTDTVRPSAKEDVY